ncbi:MAG: YHYH protein [Mycobacteriales bacterium]
MVLMVRSRVAAVGVALTVVTGGLAACSSASGSAATSGVTPAAQAVHHAAARSTSHRLTLDTSHNYGDKYSDGLLPVGDGKYRTTGAKKGYIYACSQYASSLNTGQGGASSRGPWFKNNNTEYQVNDKVHVQGSVSWPSAKHTIKTVGSKRKITTNDLPTSHTTGTFPVASSDPAHQYDANPNSITAQSVSVSLAKSPKYGSPRCMGGEVGIMTTGVVLFNALDGEGRDAGAWETQDHCDGHPEKSGAYHYHSLSSCITKLSVHHVIGWALDGFPITGPYVHGAKNQLTTSNLDKCHGITSKVKINGKSVTTYHYVMTQDYPYSVSCFRASAITTPIV